jgi:hypothetical protein
MEYNINRGIGRSAEYMGLKAHYLLLFVAGLLAVFLLFVIMYAAGAGEWLSIGVCLSAATAVVRLTFRMNRRYGEHGLTKLRAARLTPRFIINRKPICKLFTHRYENND